MGGHIAAVVELRFGDLDDDTLATNTEALALLTSQLAERFEELDARQKLDEAGLRPRLARFLSPGQIDAVLLQPDVLAPGGVRCDAAVLWLQFRGVGFGETETPAVDAGQWARQLARVRESVARIVSGLDGTLIHFGPDAMLAVWGWPLRPEHDGNATAAVLAVRAAQQLHGTLKTQLANGHSTPRGMLGTARQPRFGIGIEFGPVFAAGIEGSSGLDLVVMGETVHIARGLADRAAAREEILVGETSHHAIDGAFAVTGHETVRLKVSDGPMRAHRIAVGQPGGVETGLGRVAAPRN
jgi:class 3 adenylate cyclase